MKLIRQIILIIILTSAIQAQTTNRKALLIHGFGSDGETWINKHTPQDLISPPDNQPSIVDSCFTFSYNLADSIAAYPDDPPFSIFQNHLIPGIAHVMTVHSLEPSDSK